MNQNCEAVSGEVLRAKRGEGIEAACRQKGRADIECRTEDTLDMCVLGLTMIHMADEKLPRLLQATRACGWLRL